jgi:hypothetical protein
MEFQKKTNSSDNNSGGLGGLTPSRSDEQPNEQPRVSSPPPINVPDSKPVKAVAAPRFGEPSGASKILVILLIISSLIFITAMSLQLADSLSNKDSGLQYDVDKIYLVTLGNDQTYAGKLSRINDEFFLLNETYQVSLEDNQPVVVRPSDGKFGVENTLYLDITDVVYWQAIPDDSTLGQLISNYKNTSKSNLQEKTTESEVPATEQPTKTESKVESPETSKPAPTNGQKTNPIDMGTGATQSPNPNDAQKLNDGLSQ